MKEKIVMISPMYNEEECIERVINGVLAQSVRPSQWIIVDDGSTDKSVEIVEKYSTIYPWITLIDSNITMNVNYGPKIVSVRTVGYNYIIENNIKFDYLAHLDSDIVLCETYLKDIIESFTKDQKLGICAGRLILENGIVETTRSVYVRDGNRVFRKQCLDQIGYQKYMWLHDSSDKMQALFYGWNVYSIDNVSLHLRPTGKKLKIKYCYAMGVDTNRFGYNFIAGMIKSLRYMKRKPFVIAWVAFCFGYIVGYTKKAYYSKEFNRYVSKFYIKDVLKK